MRYYVFSEAWKFRRRAKHKTLLGYLGYRGPQRQRIKLYFAAAIIGCLLIVTAVYFAFVLSEPQAPITVPALTP